VRRYADRDHWGARSREFIAVCGDLWPFVRYAAVPDYNLSYFYVFVFFVVGAGFVTVLLSVSRLVAPRKPSLEKSRTYESGEEPVGQAWGRYPSHFYVFALLFVVFDVEVIFLFPWAVLFRSLGWNGLVEMAVFILILVVGLFYAWRKQVLRWY
jgi:NADH-quinone oxidoreductase subunit A